MNEEVESSWECTICDISVPSEKKRCTACLRWRPGFKPTTEELRMSMSMKRKPEAGNDEDDKGDDKPAAKNRRSTREEVEDKKSVKKKSKSSAKGRLKKSDEDSYSGGSGEEDSVDGWDDVDDDDDDDDNKDDGKLTGKKKSKKKWNEKSGTIFQPDGGGYYYGGEGKDSKAPQLMDDLQQSYSNGIVTVLGTSPTSLDRASIESAMKELDGYKGGKWLGAYFNINLRNLVVNGTLSEQGEMYELVNSISTNTVANPRNNGRFCAECGDKNNLTKCCDNGVWYCGDNCKEIHLPLHKFNCALRCVNCGEEDELTECCGGVKYCSEECRIAHLPTHKLKCEYAPPPECVKSTVRNDRGQLKVGYCKYCKKNHASWYCSACSDGLCADAKTTRWVHEGECFKKHLKEDHNIELDESGDESE